VDENPYGHKLCACRLPCSPGHPRPPQRQHTGSALENSQGKGPLVETGAGVFKVASSQLAGTQTPSAGFCSHKKKNKIKEYC